VSAFAWLLVQPPDVGPYVDFLYATYGDTLVAVAAANVGTRTDHRIAASLARKIAEVARSHPA
jgi:hypothetical protein